jgi:hypothetical protein
MKLRTMGRANEDPESKEAVLVDGDRLTGERRSNNDGT